MILIQATRNAMANDLVVRNVAELAVSMLGGIRTEEARALRWSEVDLDAGTVTVYRSVRLRPVYAYRCHRAGSAVREQRKDSGGQS